MSHWHIKTNRTFKTINITTFSWTFAKHYIFIIKIYIIQKIQIIFAFDAKFNKMLPQKR